MFVGHFLKRELETLFVHRFSNDTMPFFNLFKNCFHYWFVFGFLNAFFFFHPRYTPPSWASENTFKVLAGVFGVFEFLNLMAHITLKNLRKPGSTERGIPKGWGFDQVSCANYFWEIMCWITFAAFSQVFGCNFIQLKYYFSLHMCAILILLDVSMGSPEAQKVQERVP